MRHTLCFGSRKEFRRAEIRGFLVEVSSSKYLRLRKNENLPYLAANKIFDIILANIKPLFYQIFNNIKQYIANK